MRSVTTAAAASTTMLSGQGSGRLEVVAHEDAVEAAPLGVSGLLARVRTLDVPGSGPLNITDAPLCPEGGDVGPARLARRMGFDPSLGLMHADKRYRPSLASDVMEPARPAADAITVELLEGRQLRRREVFETRKGTCRLGRSLARELASFVPELSEAVAPHLERLARVLLRRRDHPTPLTRRKHRAAVAAGSLGRAGDEASAQHR